MQVSTTPSIDCGAPNSIIVAIHQALRGVAECSSVVELHNAAEIFTEKTVTESESTYNCPIVDTFADATFGRL